MMPTSMPATRAGSSPWCEFASVGRSSRRAPAERAVAEQLAVIFTPAPRSSVVLQVLVESRCLARLMVAFCEVGCVASCVGIKAGSEFEIVVLLVEVRGDRFAPRDVFVDLGQYRQSCGRAVGLADCDRTVEPDDRSVGEPEQLVVPLHDLDPVG